MKAESEIENCLEQLGNDWPTNGSLVSRVSQSLDSLPQLVRPAQSNWFSPRLSIAVVAASVLLLVWILYPRNSLYAQILSGFERAKSFQMVSTIFTGDPPVGKQNYGTWIERNTGFREETQAGVLVGSRLGSWRLNNGSDRAIHTRSNDIQVYANEVLDNEVVHMLKNMVYERILSQDQVIQGQNCRAYLIKNSRAQNNVEGVQVAQREIIFLDEQNRIVRGVGEQQSKDGWKPLVITDFQYDAPIDPAMFEPNFGDDIRIVDADKAFEDFVDLSKAVYQEEKHGLIYAIHHIERFEDGGIYVISSVRGTDETLRKFPLKRERFNKTMTRVTGPGDHYHDSFGTRLWGFDHATGAGAEIYDIELATADFEGVNVKWRALIPPESVKNGSLNAGLDPITKEPFKLEPGQVKFPVGMFAAGTYGESNLIDDRGVRKMITWDVVLNVPDSPVLPSLDKITAIVYGDLTILADVDFKYLNMGHRALSAARISDLQLISLEQYQAAVEGDVEWWKAGCPMDDPRRLEQEGKFALPKNK